MFLSNEYTGIAAAKDCADGADNLVAVGSGEGLSLVKNFGMVDKSAAHGAQDTAAVANITRTYNTGYVLNLPAGGAYPAGVYLANSKTLDRASGNPASRNPLTENGTVTEAAVASGAELKAYSGFSASNYLSRAYDADFDFATGMSFMYWIKILNNSALETVFMRTDTSGNAPFYGSTIHISNGKAQFYYYTAAGGTGNVAATNEAVDDGEWHFIVGVQDFAGIWSGGTPQVRIYLDGKPNSGSTQTYGVNGSFAHGDALLNVGENPRSDTSAPLATGSVSLLRFSKTVPSEKQIKEIYEAEKGMFAANAECLLQSGSTDAVLDVSVDPISDSRVLVTQTDAITIFKNDGLVVESKPTVNSGSSEKGKLWGNLRTEQNSANTYVTAPAVDQRQVNEMVRSLASEMPPGLDLGTAKAWCNFTGSGTAEFKSSYNMKSITDNGLGDWTIMFAEPFISENSMVQVTGSYGGSANYHGPVTRHDNDGLGGTGARILHWEMNLSLIHI